MHMLKYATKDIISIHALHEESDILDEHAAVHTARFQSTLSMRRATHCGDVYHQRDNQFQSTLSMRRATPACLPVCFSSWYFNPRSP